MAGCTFAKIKDQFFSHPDHDDGDDLLRAIQCVLYIFLVHIFVPILYLTSSDPFAPSFQFSSEAKDSANDLVLHKSTHPDDDFIKNQRWSKEPHEMWCRDGSDVK